MPHPVRDVLGQPVLHRNPSAASVDTLRVDLVRGGVRHHQDGLPHPLGIGQPGDHLAEIDVVRVLTRAAGDPVKDLDDRVPPVLVIIVLVLLPHVVRRVADDHRDLRFALAVHALRVRFAEHRQLAGLGEIERVHET